MVVDGQEAPVVEGAQVEQQMNEAAQNEQRPAQQKTGKMIDDGNVGNSAKMFVGGEFIFGDNKDSIQIQI